MRYFNTYPNRTLCDVLKEMRTMYKTCNFSTMPGLIEEAQTMGNRMEAALEDRRDVKDTREYLDELKNEIIELKKEKNSLEKQIKLYNEIKETK